MAKPRVTHELVNVTPTQAASWLANNTFPGQRTLRNYHVVQLMNKIQAGTFRPGTAISFAVMGGKWILVNGQHTLNALIRTGTTLSLLIELHHISTPDEIGALYGSFDVQARRSPADIFAAHGFAEEYGLSHQNTGAFSAAMMIVISGFVGAARGKDHPANIYLSDTENRLEIMKAWIEPARMYCQTFIGDIPLLQAAQSRRANIMAVGILTFRYQPTKAQEFWTRIARREHLTMNIPEYRLNTFLDSTTGMEKRAGFTYARTVAAAWNATFRGRMMLKALTPRNITLPILIEGTPFNGKKQMMYFSEGKVHAEPVILPGQEKESAC